jgi:hypothetical protein
MVCLTFDSSFSSAAFSSCASFSSVEVVPEDVVDEDVVDEEAVDEDVVDEDVVDADSLVCSLAAALCVCPHITQIVVATSMPDKTRFQNLFFPISPVPLNP